MENKMIRYGQEVEMFIEEYVKDFEDKKEIGNIDEIRKLCGNIEDKEEDERYELKEKKLKEMKEDVEERMREIEEKRSEYELWMKRREEFVRKEKDEMVDIIQKMKKDEEDEKMEMIGDEEEEEIIIEINKRV